MAKIEVELSIKELEAFKNLVTLLEVHFEDLPEQLQSSLKQISEEGINDLDVDDWNMATMGISDDIATINSLGENIFIKRINKALKRIYYIQDGDNRQKYSEPEHFWIKKGDTIIWEW